MSIKRVSTHGILFEFKIEDAADAKQAQVEYTYYPGFAEGVFEPASPPDIEIYEVYLIYDSDKKLDLMPILTDEQLTAIRDDIIYFEEEERSSHHA